MEQTTRTAATFARIEYNGADLWIAADVLNNAQSVDDLVATLCRDYPPESPDFYKALIVGGRYTFYR